MDLLAVSNLSNGPVINIIQWLQAERLLVDPLRCVPCNRPMDLIERNQEHVDGYIWLVQFSHSACCRVSLLSCKKQTICFRVYICARSIQVRIMQFIFYWTLSIAFNFDSGDVLGVASESPCALEAFLESFLEFLLVKLYSYCICGATHTIQVKIQVHNFRPQFMAMSLNSSNSSKQSANFP